MGVLKARVAPDTWHEVPGGPAGPAGPAGPPGPAGDPGEPGGSLLSSFWSYATATTAPPANGQIRTNDPITQLWVAEQDTDGYTRTAGLGTILSTSRVLVRAANGTAMDLQITGAPVDNGTYWTFPVSVISGTVTKGARTQLNFITPQPVGIPAGGTVAQVLTKTGPADYAAGWAAPYLVLAEGAAVPGGTPIGTLVIYVPA